MEKDTKYSPAKLYIFQPKDDIKSEQVLELTDKIKIGVSGDTLKNMSDELKEHFIEKEVA